MILADAGVPMLFVQFPALLCALIPVILAEFLVARRMIGAPPKQAFKAVAIANLVSTVVGYPLLWALLFAVEFSLTEAPAGGLHSIWGRIYAVTIQAPWLYPYEADLKWMIPVAALYLLVPAFFTSVFLERWICGRFWRGEDPARIRRFSWAAHGASYAVLLVVAWIYYALVVRRT
jgi:hypothetical protein